MTGFLQPRQSSDGGPSNGQTIMIVVIVVVVVIIVAYLSIYTYLRRLRLAGREPPVRLSGKLRQRWDRWTPSKKYSSVDLTERGEGLTNQSTAYHGISQPAANGSTDATTTTGAGFDRSTSVRSVMTLPPYSYTPKESEQVLGREGERGGMDTVLEFPETQEEEEAHREGEMESLYQIRQARRREIAEREERRRERRQARERGDSARVERLRREARQRVNGQNQSTGNLTADILIAEHQSRPKDRRVSSVAYAEVGQVRHDGTRLRANSHESERGGLLDGAAPMGQDNHGRTASDATSLLTLDNLARPSPVHVGGRQRSDSEALSFSTVSSSDFFPEPTPGTVDGESRHSSDGLQIRSGSISDESTGAVRLTPPETDSSPDSNDHNSAGSGVMTGNADHHLSRPPEYDDLDWGDAPTYEEALRRRESQRSARLAVPTINVHLASEPSSPNLSRVEEGHERER